MARSAPQERMEYPAVFVLHRQRARPLVRAISIGAGDVALYPIIALANFGSPASARAVLRLVS